MLVITAASMFLSSKHFLFNYRSFQKDTKIVRMNPHVLMIQLQLLLNHGNMTAFIPSLSAHPLWVILMQISKQQHYFILKHLPNTFERHC